MLREEHSPNPLHDRRQRLLRWSAIILLTLAILGALIYGITRHRPTTQWIKSQYLEQQLQEIEERMEHRDWIEAARSASKLYSRFPEELPVLRLMARLASKTSHPEALYFWNRLQEKGALQEEDALACAAALSQHGKHQDALLILNTHLQEQPKDLESLHLLLTITKQFEDPTYYQEALQWALSQHPNEARFRYQETLQALEAPKNSSSSASSSSAYHIAQLWTIAEDPSSTGLKAIRRLLQESHSRPEWERLLTLLQQHPKSTAQDHADALQRQLDFHPTQAPKLLSSTLETLQTADAQEALPYLQLLQQKGQHHDILRTLQARGWSAHPNFIKIECSSLAILGKYGEIEQLLKENAALLHSHDRLLYQAHLALIKEEPPNHIYDLLDQAIKDASNSAQGQALLRLGSYCQKQQLPELALKAWNEAKQQPGLQKLGRFHLLHHHMRTQNYQHCLDILHELTLYDQSESLELLIHYLSISLGHDIEKELQHCKEQHQASLASGSTQKQQQWAYLQALCHLHQGQLQQAQNLLQTSQSTDTATATATDLGPYQQNHQKLTEHLKETATTATATKSRARTFYTLPHNHSTPITAYLPATFTR